MPTFEELYRRLLLASIQNSTKEELARLAAGNYDRRQLDCLFHPECQPVVWRLGQCTCPPEDQERCASACQFGALQMEKEGPVPQPDKCVGCGECVPRCREENLVIAKDGVAVMEALRSKQGLAYALVAPAFLGQFGRNVTPGRLRTALKRMGFDGMIEVAAFADILTLKEALEFDHNIVDESDYQLTSCCCPMWIAMIRKVYGQLMPHVPAAVSPMIAAGRTIKHLHPDALTVFIGPCIAKKAEAREPDLKGAVDFVLTFQEMQELFSLLRLDPAAMEESEKDFSSRAGRIYARAGGVSEAVKDALDRLNPNREIGISSQKADGVPACKALLNALLAGETTANFFEGMGCVGGCVGGPKVIIDKAEAKELVDQYGAAATYPTPIDNPYVVDLLRRLGFDTPEQLLRESDIFTRKF